MSSRTYRPGTVLLRTNGYAFVKGRDGKWEAMHRKVASLKLLDRDLDIGEKVYHKDNTLKGKPGYDDHTNLIVVKFRTTKWVKLPRTVVLFEPKLKPVRDLVLR